MEMHKTPPLIVKITYLSVSGLNKKVGKRLIGGLYYIFLIEVSPKIKRICDTFFNTDEWL